MCPTVNMRQAERAHWRQNSFDSLSEATKLLTEPFSLEGLYPSREIEWPPESGQFREVRQIMPHQQKLHEGITPSGKQADFIMLSGGVGNGKSVNLCVECTKLLRKYPGIKILWVAPYDWMFLESLFPTLTTVLPEDSPYVQKVLHNDGIWKMRNGAQMRFKSYEDATRIRGFQEHCIFITEAAQIGDSNPYKAMEIFNALCERLRAPGNYPRRIYIDQNPSGHNWSWKKFVKPNPLGDEGLLTVIPPEGYRQHEVQFREFEYTDDMSGKTFYTISAGTYANPFNPPGYLGQMQANRRGDPLMRARMIDGSFTPIHTLIYDLPYYSKQSHIIDVDRFCQYWELDSYAYDDPRDAIPRNWPLWVGIDCAGTSSPWAIEFYVETPEDENGYCHYICFDEIYETTLTWSAIAKKILARLEGWEFARCFIDPHHSTQQLGPNAESIYNEFQRYGVPVELPLANGKVNYNKKGAIKRVQDYLARDRTKRCPYMADSLDTDPENPKGPQIYDVGCARLYYLAGERDGEMPDGTPLGYGPYAAANIAEKDEYRLDNRKKRTPGEHEEGLTPEGPEKIIDRDDHAQTAEMFCFCGLDPTPIGMRQRRNIDDELTHVRSINRRRL